jgi:predicted dehydrogenase
MQLGIHHVDTLAYWLGPIRRASGRFAHLHSPGDIDDVGVVTLEFESGRDMLADELAEFGRCIRGEAQPETGPDEGIAALAAVLQALGAQTEAVA